LEMSGSSFNSSFANKRTISRRGSPQIRAIVRSELSRTMEHKFLSVVAAAGSTNNSGVIIDLQSALTRGTAGVNNFVGNSLLADRVWLSCTFANAATCGTSRIIILQWHLAGVPTPANILALVGVTNAVDSFYEFGGYQENFTIHYDSLYQSPLYPVTGAAVITFTGVGSNFRKTNFPTGSVVPGDGGLFGLIINNGAAQVVDYHMVARFTDA